MPKTLFMSWIMTKSLTMDENFRKVQSDIIGFRPLLKWDFIYSVCKTFIIILYYVGKDSRTFLLLFTKPTIILYSYHQTERKFLIFAGNSLIITKIWHPASWKTFQQSIILFLEEILKIWWKNSFVKRSNLKKKGYMNLFFIN